MSLQYVCDGCGSVVSNDPETDVLPRFITVTITGPGPALQPTVKKHFCPPCAKAKDLWLW